MRNNFKAILGEFNKEQEAFIKGQGGRSDSAVAPWIGRENEEKIKEEILSLSAVNYTLIQFLVN